MTSQLSPLFSWRGQIAAPDSGLQSTTRHVALTLSLHMNERGGSCFPAIETLAGETGLTYDTVRRHLRILRESGWLATEERRRGEGRGTTVFYSATTPGLTTGRETTGGLSTGGPTGDHRASDAATTGRETPGVEDANEGVSEGVSSALTLLSEDLDSASDADRSFDAFWALYPNRQKKPDARAAFKKALVKLGGRPEPIMDGLGRWLLSESWQREPQFIPHPSSWLNQERWNDEPMRSSTANVEAVFAAYEAAGVKPGELFGFGSAS